MKKTFLIIFVLLIILVYVVFLHKTPIEKVIDKGIEFLADENNDGLLAIVSQEYAGENGVQYEDIPDLLTEIFRIFDHIKIVVEKREERIIQKNHQVEVSLKFKVIASAGGQRGYIKGGPASAEEMKILFVLENNQWKVRRILGPVVTKEQLQSIQDLF